MIAGYTPDNPLDALIVGYYEGDELMFASKVRNRFVPTLRREIWSKLKGLQMTSAHLPTYLKRNEHNGRHERRDEELRLAQASARANKYTDGSQMDI